MALPPPPSTSFASDNAAGVVPEVMAALAAANQGAALAYGSDEATARVEALLAERFDTPVVAVPCWGGTGGNIVALASLLEPHEAVVASSCAHIVVDEAGALARMAGNVILTVPHLDGKITPGALRAYEGWRAGVHHPHPRVLSLTQSTEYGTCYTVDELGALVEAAHRAGLVVHLDGARLGNAVAALGTDLATMVRDTGVDVVTFGLTKAGAMYGETVVFLRAELARRAPHVRKQLGQLASKARFIAAQTEALVVEDRWLVHAAHANAMATRLADAVDGSDGGGGIAGVRLLRRPEVNAVLAYVPPEAVAPLQDWSFFWEWEPATALVRWMTSWATTPDDVDAFVAGVRAVVAAHLHEPGR